MRRIIRNTTRSVFRPILAFALACCMVFSQISVFAEEAHDASHGLSGIGSSLGTSAPAKAKTLLKMSLLSAGSGSQLDLLSDTFCSAADAFLTYKLNAGAMDASTKIVPVTLDIVLDEDYLNDILDGKMSSGA